VLLVLLTTGPTLIGSARWPAKAKTA
jgi:hypothetical protein